MGSEFLQTRELTRQLACSIVVAQDNLDRDYAQRILEWENVRRHASTPEERQLADLACPQRFLVHEMTVDCRAAATCNVESTFGIATRFINASFERRFAHAQTSMIRMEISVRHVDAESATPKKKSR